MAFANSGNAAAQGPFGRGLALLHNFEYPRAAAAFRDAQQADPDFAMAYWGEAMSHNHPLWMEQDLASARRVLARLAPSPSARLAKAGSKRERAWLEAVEELYGVGTKVERDRRYAARMEQIFKTAPDDIDARAFAALAILGLAHNGRDHSIYMRAASLLEEGIATHPRHPGVLHYMIHSYDDPVHAPLGLRAAQHYSAVAPDAPHALHMTSHIFLALGRWDDVEKSNRTAIATLNRQRAAAGQAPTNCSHSTEWLAYALIQQGNSAEPLISACRVEAVAEVAAKPDATRLGPRRSGFNSWSDMAMREGIERGRWVAPPMLPDDQSFLLGRFNLAYGELFAAGADLARVAATRAKLDRLFASIVEALPLEAPNDTLTKTWLERAVTQAEALELLAKGREVQAIALLDKAADAEAALPIEFGPPPLAKPSAELLGDILLKRGRHKEALQAYRRVLAAMPGRRLALAGEAAARLTSPVARPLASNGATE